MMLLAGLGRKRPRENEEDDGAAGLASSKRAAAQGLVADAQPLFSQASWQSQGVAQGRAPTAAAIEPRGPALPCPMPAKGGQIAAQTHGNSADMAAGPAPLWSCLKDTLAAPNVCPCIGVDGTTRLQWHRFLQAVVQHGVPYTLFENGAQVAQFSHSLADIFEPDAIVMCEITLCLPDVSARCFLLSECSIECGFKLSTDAADDCYRQILWLAEFLSEHTDRPYFVGALLPGPESGTAIGSGIDADTTMDIDL